VLPFAVVGLGLGVADLAVASREVSAGAFGAAVFGLILRRSASRGADGLLRLADYRVLCSAAISRREWALAVALSALGRATIAALLLGLFCSIGRLSVGTRPEMLDLVLLGFWNAFLAVTVSLGYRGCHVRLVLRGFRVPLGLYVLCAASALILVVRLRAWVSTLPVMEVAQDVSVWIVQHLPFNWPSSLLAGPEPPNLYGIRILLLVAFLVALSAVLLTSIPLGNAALLATNRPRPRRCVFYLSRGGPTRAMEILGRAHAEFDPLTRRILGLYAPLLFGLPLVSIAIGLHHNPFDMNFALSTLPIQLTMGLGGAFLYQATDSTSSPKASWVILASATPVFALNQAMVLLVLVWVVVPVTMAYGGLSVIGGAPLSASVGHSFSLLWIACLGLSRMAGRSFIPYSIGPGDGGGSEVLATTEALFITMFVHFFVVMLAYRSNTTIAVTVVIGFVVLARIFWRFRVAGLDAGLAAPT